MPCCVFIATSLDGFIAREDGGIDWLAGPDPQPLGTDGAEDFGYQAFFDSMDALVMGRNTYELVRTFGTWPYGKKPVVVLTTRPLAIPDTLASTVEVMRGSPPEVVARLAERGWTSLYIDGGKTVQAFLEHGLIDRMILSLLPVLIGTGIPLFGPVPSDIHLRLLSSRTYPGGMVQSEYEVMRG